MSTETLTIPLSCPRCNTHGEYSMSSDDWNGYWDWFNGPFHHESRLAFAHCNNRYMCVHCNKPATEGERKWS